MTYLFRLQLVPILIFLAAAVMPGNLPAQENASHNKIVHLHIDGMLTPQCPSILKSAVRKIIGVQTVEASLSKNSAVIEFDTRKTSIEKIQQVIKIQAGFSSRLM
mgnify:CR=1 FL=1